MLDTNFTNHVPAATVLCAYQKHYEENSWRRLLLVAVTGVSLRCFFHFQFCIITSHIDVLTLLIKYDKLGHFSVLTICLILLQFSPSNKTNENSKRINVSMIEASK